LVAKGRQEKSMAVKIVTNFSHLMQLASALGKAKKAGNAAEIKEAQETHDSYHALCMEHTMEIEFQGESNEISQSR
jgi:hypothetical protein